ncbi:MAG TPA: hypothetical protein VFH06_02650 [Candidatus Saccharimonadales bacterium]|nr:hypothetical protein [Candidatus Saccharimonadales bacterium]
MSETNNHLPGYKFETGGEVRVDFHMASEDLSSWQEGREIADARVLVEQAQAKEVKLTERDIALGLGQRVLTIRRWKASDVEEFSKN